MTPPTPDSDQCRAAFEKWYSDDGTCPENIEKFNNGSYKKRNATIGFTTWQAAWKSSPHAQAVEVAVDDGAPKEIDLDKLIYDMKTWSEELAQMELLDRLRDLVYAVRDKVEEMKKNG
jgi:hypothetical protein